MTGYELKQSLMNSDNDGRCFIKWWRKENDFADYSLIDQFLQHLTPESNLSWGHSELGTLKIECPF